MRCSGGHGQCPGTRVLRDGLILAQPHYEEGRCWKGPLGQLLIFQASFGISSLFFTLRVHISPVYISLDLSCFLDPLKPFILAQEISGTRSQNASKKKKSPKHKNKKQKQKPSLDICLAAAAKSRARVVPALTIRRPAEGRSASPLIRICSEQPGPGRSGLFFHLLSLRGLPSTQQFSTVSIFHCGPLRTKGKVKRARLEVLRKRKSSQSRRQRH